MTWRESGIPCIPTKGDTQGRAEILDKTTYRIGRTSLALTDLKFNAYVFRSSDAHASRGTSGKGGSKKLFGTTMPSN